MENNVAAQELLLHGAAATALAGLLSVVVGAMVDVVSKKVGARLRYFGTQSIRVSIFVLASHLALHAVLDSAPPMFVIAVMYGVVALMLLQTAINFLFGPGVGSRVIADLLSGLISGVISLAIIPIAAIRELMRRP